MSHANGHVADEHLLVPCPACGSTAKRCKRPSGHDSAFWHLEREDALARLRASTCRACADWLRVREAAAKPAQKQRSLFAAERTA